MGHERNRLKFRPAENEKRKKRKKRRKRTKRRGATEGGGVLGEQ